MAALSAITIPLTVHAPGIATTEVGQVSIPLHAETGESVNGAVPVRLRCGDPVVELAEQDCDHDNDATTVFDVWAESPYALAPTEVGELTCCPRCRPDLFPIDIHQGGKA